MINVDSRTAKKLSSTTVVTPMKLESSLSEIFHENTKLTPKLGRGYYAHISSIMTSPRLMKVLRSPSKTYTLSERVPMHRPEPGNFLERTIAQRRSARQFSGEPISLEQLSRLLHFSYGVTDQRNRYRAVASGGALYPLELYVVSSRVDGLAPGVYHYDPDLHSLDIVDHACRWKDVQANLGLDYFSTETIAAFVIITAIFERTTLKYLDRGYRMLLMEAGEAAQNFSLVATSLQLGCCLIGGFLDQPLAESLGLDGLEEAPLVPIAIGSLPVRQGLSGNGSRADQ